MKICVRCGIEIPPDENAKTSSYCRKCRNAYQRENRERMKKSEPKITAEEKAKRMEEWKSLIISRKGPHDVDAVERSKNGKRTNTNQ